MFVLEKTYDIDELCRNNMHTHSLNSLCAGREMDIETMIREAEKAGLSTIAITDHSDKGSNINVLQNTLDYKERLKTIDTKLRVLIGSELSAYGIGLYSDTDELNAALDYRSYSFTHYHLNAWEQPEDRSPYGYSRHMLAVVSSMIDFARADSFAHPFSPEKMKFFNPDEKHEVLSHLSDNELGDVMERAERAGIAWELHQGMVFFCPEFIRRFFYIGKEVGVHFTVGTDAHHPDAIPTNRMAEELKRILK